LQGAKASVDLASILRSACVCYATITGACFVLPSLTWVSKPSTALHPPRHPPVTVVHTTPGARVKTQPIISSSFELSRISKAKRECLDNLLSALVDYLRESRLAICFRFVVFSVRNQGHENESKLNLNSDARVPLDAASASSLAGGCPFAFARVESLAALPRSSHSPLNGAFHSTDVLMNALHVLPVDCQCSALSRRSTAWSTGIQQRGRPALGRRSMTRTADPQHTLRQVPTSRLVINLRDTLSAPNGVPRWRPKVHTARAQRRASSAPNGVFLPRPTTCSAGSLHRSPPAPKGTLRWRPTACSFGAQRRAPSAPNGVLGWGPTAHSAAPIVVFQGRRAPPSLSAHHPTPIAHHPTLSPARSRLLARPLLARTCRTRNSTTSLWFGPFVLAAVLCW
jgi:hypothetical protein